MPSPASATTSISSRRVLVLLTDGANTTGAQELVQATELAVKRHLVIYTIGILQPVYDAQDAEPRIDFDEKTLTSIAEQTGGKYFRARQTQEFEKIYAILDRLEPAESDDQAFRPVKELFYWPLAAAVIVVLGSAALSLAVARRRSCQIFGALL